MPWWSWILLWSALVLALCGMLVWFGFTLFKKLMAAVDALEELGDQVAGLDPGPSDAPARRFTPAVLRNRDDLLLEVDRLRAARTHRRQVRRDGLINRGKLLRNAPPTQRTNTHA